MPVLNNAKKNTQENLKISRGRDQGQSDGGKILILICILYHYFLTPWTYINLLNIKFNMGKTKDAI